jgi:hypothetical protein
MRVDFSAAERSGAVSQRRFTVTAIGASPSCVSTLRIAATVPLLGNDRRFERQQTGLAPLPLDQITHNQPSPTKKETGHEKAYRARKNARPVSPERSSDSPPRHNMTIMLCKIEKKTRYYDNFLEKKRLLEMNLDSPLKKTSIAETVHPR